MIHCDKCKENFSPDLIEENGYQFFFCPECGVEYPVGHITPKGIELRDELKKARQKLNSMIDLGYTKEAIQRQQTVVEKILGEYQKEYVKATP